MNEFETLFETFETLEEKNERLTREEAAKIKAERTRLEREAKQREREQKEKERKERHAAEVNNKNQVNGIQPQGSSDDDVSDASLSNDDESNPWALKKGDYNFAVQTEVSSAGDDLKSVESDLSKNKKEDNQVSDIHKTHSTLATVAEAEIKSDVTVNNVIAKKATLDDCINKMEARLSELVKVNREYEEPDNADLSRIEWTLVHKDINTALICANGVKVYIENAIEGSLRPVAKERNGEVVEIITHIEKFSKKLGENESWDRNLLPLADKFARIRTRAAKNARIIEEKGEKVFNSDLCKVLNMFIDAAMESTVFDSEKNEMRVIDIARRALDIYEGEISFFTSKERKGQVEEIRDILDNYMDTWKNGSAKSILLQKLELVTANIIQNAKVEGKGFNSKLWKIVNKLKDDLSGLQQKPALKLLNDIDVYDKGRRKGDDYAKTRETEIRCAKDIVRAELSGFPQDKIAALKALVKIKGEIKSRPDSKKGSRLLEILNNHILSEQARNYQEFMDAYTSSKDIKGLWFEGLSSEDCSILCGNGDSQKKVEMKAGIVYESQITPSMIVEVLPDYTRVGDSFAGVIAKFGKIVDEQNHQTVGVLIDMVEQKINNIISFNNKINITFFTPLIAGLVSVLQKKTENGKVEDYEKYKNLEENVSNFYSARLATFLKDESFIGLHTFFTDEKNKDARALLKQDSEVQKIRDHANKTLAIEIDKALAISFTTSFDQDKFQGVGEKVNALEKIGVGADGGKFAFTLDQKMTDDINLLLKKRLVAKLNEGFKNPEKILELHTFLANPNQFFNIPQFQSDVFKTIVAGVAEYAAGEFCAGAAFGESFKDKFEKKMKENIINLLVNRNHTEIQALLEKAPFKFHGYELTSDMVQGIILQYSNKGMPEAEHKIIGDVYKSKFGDAWKNELDVKINAETYESKYKNILVRMKKHGNKTSQENLANSMQLNLRLAQNFALYLDDEKMKVLENAIAGINVGDGRHYTKKILELFVQQIKFHQGVEGVVALTQEENKLFDQYPEFTKRYNAIYSLVSDKEGITGLNSEVGRTIVDFVEADRRGESWEKALENACLFADFLKPEGSGFLEKVSKFLSLPHRDSLVLCEAKVMIKKIDDDIQYLVGRMYPPEEQKYKYLTAYSALLRPAINAFESIPEGKKYLNYLNILDLLLDDKQWKSNVDPFEKLGFTGEGAEARFTQVLKSLSPEQSKVLMAVKNERLLKGYNESRNGSSKTLTLDGKTAYPLKDKNVMSHKQWRFMGFLNLGEGLNQDNLVYRAMNMIRKLTAAEAGQDKNFAEQQNLIKNALGIIMAHGDKAQLHGDKVQLDECEFRLRALFYRHAMMKAANRSMKKDDELPACRHTRELINIMMEQLPPDRSQKYKSYKNNMDLPPINLSENSEYKALKVAEEYLQIFELIDLALKSVDKKGNPTEGKRIRKQLYLWRHSVLVGDKLFSPNIPDEEKIRFQPLITSLKNIKFDSFNASDANSKLQIINAGLIKMMLSLDDDTFTKFIVKLSKLETGRKEVFWNSVRQSDYAIKEKLKERLSKICEEMSNQLYESGNKTSPNLLKEHQVVDLRNITGAMIEMNIKAKNTIEEEGKSILQKLHGIIREIESESVPLDDGTKLYLLRMIREIEVASAASSRLRLGLLQTLLNVAESKNELKNFILQQFNKDPNSLNAIYLNEIFKSYVMERKIDQVFVEKFSSMLQIKISLRKMMDADPRTKQDILDRVTELKAKIGDKKDCYGFMLLSTISQIQSDMTFSAVEKKCVETIAEIKQDLEKLKLSPNDSGIFNMLVDRIAFIRDNSHVDSYYRLEMGKILLGFIEGSGESYNAEEMDNLKANIKKLFGGIGGIKSFCLEGIFDKGRLGKKIENVLKTKVQDEIKQHFDFAKRLYDGIDGNMNDTIGDNCLNFTTVKIEKLGEYGSKLKSILDAPKVPERSPNNRHLF